MSDPQLTTPLRKVRIAVGLSGVDVANAVDIAQSTYSKLEAEPGYRTSADVAERIAKFFGPPLTEEMILWPERFPRFMQPETVPA
jgi:DNA-binding XRE family transcriptional regulator